MVRVHVRVEHEGDPHALARGELDVRVHVGFVRVDHAGANVIERGVALSTSDTLGRDDLAEELFETAPSGVLVPSGVGYHEAVVEAKRAILRQALEAEGGHQTRAARRLGLTQPYLARLLKKLDLR